VRCLAAMAAFSGASASLVYRDDMSLMTRSEELSNSIAAAAAAVKSLPTREFLKTFEICGQCHQWKRFGESHDGGYLMCLDHNASKPRLQAAFSMGVEHHDQWSEDVSSAFGVPVYQYDCTVSRAPEGCPKFDSKLPLLPEVHEALRRSRG